MLLKVPRLFLCKFSKELYFWASTFEIYHIIFWVFINRSCRQKCSVKKAVFKNFSILTRKHLCWSLFMIKSQAFRSQTWNFIKKRLQHRCFSVNTAKFLGTPILRNIYELRLLYQSELSGFYYCCICMFCCIKKA